MSEGNGWKEKYILEGLDRNAKGITGLTTSVDGMKTELSKVRTEIAKLKITAGLWGAAAGTVPTLAAVLYMIFGM